MSSTTYKLDSQSSQANVGFWGDFGAGIKTIGAEISDGLAKIFATVGINSLATTLKNYGQELRDEVLAYKNEKAMLYASKQHTQDTNNTLSSVEKILSNTTSSLDNFGKSMTSAFMQKVSGGETTHFKRSNSDNFMQDLVDKITKTNFSSIEENDTIDFKRPNQSLK